MAIVYEAPQPLNTEISRLYGGAEVSTKNNPVVANTLGESNRMRLAQANAEADRSAARAARTQAIGAQMAAQASENLQRGAIAQDQFRLAQDEMEQRRLAQANQMQMQAQQVQAQERMQQQRMQAQLVMQQQELSQAEKMRMQRMQTAMTTISSDPTLDPQAKSDLILQLQAGISPLQSRLAATKLQAEDLQLQQLRKAAEMQSVFEATGQQMAAKTFEARVFTATGMDGQPMLDPQTGQPQRYYLDKSGDPQPWPPKPEAEKAAKIEPFDISKAMKDAEAEATIAFADDKVDLDGKVTVSKEQLDRRNSYKLAVFERERRAYEARQRAGQQTQQAAQPSGPVEASIDLPPVQPSVTPHDAQPGLWGNGASAQQSMPPIELLAETQRPFNRIDPETWTPEQQSMMKANRELERRAKELPEDKQKQVESAVDQAEEILATYGHPALIAGDDRARFDAALLKIRQLLPANQAEPFTPKPPMVPQSVWDTFLEGSRGADWEAGSF